MLENGIRTLILLTGDIVNRVLQNFILFDRTNVQHSIIIKGALVSWGEECAAAGDSDGITGAPS